MINARHRFHGRGSLKRVYNDGRTVRGQNISLKYLPRGCQRPYRVAVVVSRKVHKSAVTRNRIRRRIYEIVRQSDNELLDGRDIVFTVFSDKVADVDADKLAANVQALLQKAGQRGGESSQTPVSHAIVNNNAKKQGK